MRQTIKKTVALLLSLVMLLSICVVSVGATENDEPYKTITFDESWKVLADSTDTPSTISILNDGGALRIAPPKNNPQFNCAVGATIEDVTIGARSKWTIDFAMTTYADLARYVYFDTDFECGFLIMKTTAAFSDNFGNTGAVKFSDLGITTSTTKWDSNHTTTYYRVELDAAACTVTLYVLSTNGWVKLLTNNNYKIPDDGCLTLVFGGRNHASAVRLAIFSEVKIYDTSEPTTVSVTCDGKTEEIAIKGDEYTLPTAKKAGYILTGWKVNGATVATPAGTVIPTEGLTTLEAVFEKVMSEVFVQFGNTTASATDMRIVGVLDSLNYKSIGYKVSIKKAGVEIYSNDAFELTTVYTSLTAKYGAETVTLESLGYGSTQGYLTALTIQNIPTGNAGITVELTAYQIDTEDNRVEGDTVIIDFDATWANSSAAQ